MRNKRIKIISGVMLCLFFITACGSGGGVDTPVVTPSAPIITLSQSTYDFAGIVLNNYADRKFNITNTGNANLDIGTISTPALPFSISAGSNTCSNTTLAPSQTCSFMARFTPTSEGSFTATISIPSNLPTRTISLSGDGYGLNVWINQITSGSCPTMTIDVTVNGPSGPLTGLGLSDFIVTQNSATQTIIPGGLIPKDPDPFSVVLALDLSASLGNPPYPANVKSAAVDFVNLFPARTTALDQAAVYKFRDKYIFDPAAGGFRTPKTDSVTLVNYINDTTLETPVNLPDGTALNEALYAAIAKAKTGTAGQKKAVIILSDGVADPQHTEDCGGVTCTKQIVIDYAKADPKVSIFTIFYVDLAVYSDADPAIMQQLAQDTGGQYYNSGSGSSAELSGIFGQIFNMLSNKYSITYTSTPSICSGLVSIGVQVTSGGLTGLDTRAIVLP